MFINMIKKEFIQLFRNKGNVFMLFAFPIILITTLSIGLKSMMEFDNDIFDNDGEKSIIYYAEEEGSEEYSIGFNSFIQGVEDAVSINFEKVTSLDEVKDKVDKYEAVAFVDITSDGFSMYSSKNGEKTPAKIFKSMMDNVLINYSVYNVVREYNPENLRDMVKSEYNEYIENQDMGGVRNMTSTEFYTFAELALIILYVSTSVSESVYEEKVLNTLNRIKLSKSSEHLIIFSKVFMGWVISIMQTTLIYFYTSIFLKLDWGSHVFKLFSMFAALGLFASTLGALVGYSSKKDTAGAQILSGCIFLICFLGGCYVPLVQVILIPVINKLVYISPIYWIDTAASSILCNIESNAYTIAMILPLSLSAISIILYLIFVRRKGGMANA